VPGGSASPGSSPGAPTGSLVLGSEPAIPAPVTGPFSGCVEEDHCAGLRKPVHISKSLVIPGVKNGGTELVFALKKGALVRFTIVRVYPSCKRIGSFAVDAHSGVNRVEFDGSYAGNPLAAGTYRLLVHAQGQEQAAAALTIVISPNQAKPAVVSRARNANTCTAEQAREIEAAAAAEALGGSGGDRGLAALGKPGKVLQQVAVGAVKGVASKTQALAASINDSLFSPSPATLTVVGLLTLLSSCLGGLVLVRLRSRLLP
jgi:hypothetical protein